MWGFPTAYGVILVKYMEDPVLSSASHASYLLPLIGPLASGIMYCAGQSYSNLEGETELFEFPTRSYHLPSGCSDAPSAAAVHVCGYRPYFRQPIWSELREFGASLALFSLSFRAQRHHLFSSRPW